MAEKMNEVFTEVVVAPSFETEALAILTQKKNLRILQLAGDFRYPETEVKQISGGVLLQQSDRFDSVNAGDWKLVSGSRPDSDILRDLEFAWRAVRGVKSNAILLAKDGASVGIGMGQVNRVDSCRLAVERSGERVEGSVAASDAFFPFADGLQILIDAGVKAIVQPGGSVRDEEVIELAKANSIAMFFTGERHFFH
jgi:phosphoribosylaminoimidazolecarboxamide formyltransferase/IMP cyclohydrolase